MGRRAARAWAGAGAFALLVAALVPLPTRTDDARAGAYGSSPYSFPHQPHLSKAAIDAALAARPALDRPGAASRRAAAAAGGTADRECRVCHDYAKGADAHLSGCEACHVDAKHLTVDLAPAPTARRPFPHAEHLKDPAVTCFDCHRVKREMGWLEFTIPDAGLGALGVGGAPGGRQADFTCTDCHARHEPQGGTVEQDDRTGDGRPCAECHLGAREILPRTLRAGPASGSAAAQRPFLHADHGGAGANCDDCHSAVRASRTIWDHDPTAGTAERCRSCHVDAGGRSLVGIASPPRTTKVPYRLFSNFPHDRHLGAKEGKVETSGDVADGCRTCHYPETAKGGKRPFADRAPSPEPVGRETLVDYDACTPCHQPWEVAGHGVGAWACFKCHGGAADAQGRLGMARSRAERGEILRGVGFDRHHHPGVTSSGGALADSSQPGGKQCRDCHVGDVAALASRLGKRTFAHAPHLPAAPSNADCLPCHTSSATASWSLDLERFDPHLEPPTHASGADGLARGCLDCHVGARADQIGIATTVRLVPEFDHKNHVGGARWGGGTGVPCVECHRSGGAVGYETPADVADCTRCHSHDERQPEKFARTREKTNDPAAAARCRFCHEELREQATPQRMAPRAHLSLLPGKQHHDKGGDCASCHERDGAGGPAVYVERVRKARIALSVHDDRALAGEWFNDPRISRAGADPQGRTCMTCHRTEPRGYLRAPGAK